MSKITERAKAKVEVAAGTLQEATGRVLGDEVMEVKGAAHQISGHAREEAIKAGERTRGSVEEVVGAVKKTAGKVLGDSSLEAEGKVEQITGKVRRAANK